MAIVAWSLRAGVGLYCVIAIVVMLLAWGSSQGIPLRLGIQSATPRDPAAQKREFEARRASPSRNRPLRMGLEDAIVWTDLAIVDGSIEALRVINPRFDEGWKPITTSPTSSFVRYQLYLANADDERAMLKLSREATAALSHGFAWRGGEDAFLRFPLWLWFVVHGVVLAAMITVGRPWKRSKASRPTRGRLAIFARFAVAGLLACAVLLWIDALLYKRREIVAYERVFTLEDSIVPASGRRPRFRDGMPYYQIVYEFVRERGSLSVTWGPTGGVSYLMRGESWQFLFPLAEVPSGLGVVMRPPPVRASTSWLPPVWERSLGWLGFSIGSINPSQHTLRLPLWPLVLLAAVPVLAVEWLALRQRRRGRDGVCPSAATTFARRRAAARSAGGSGASPRHRQRRFVVVLLGLVVSFLPSAALPLHLRIRTCRPATASDPPTRLIHSGPKAFRVRWADISVPGTTLLVLRVEDPRFSGVWGPPFIRGISIAQLISVDPENEPTETALTAQARAGARSGFALRGGNITLLRCPRATRALSDAASISDVSSPRNSPTRCGFRATVALRRCRYTGNGRVSCSSTFRHCGPWPRCESSSFTSRSSARQPVTPRPSSARWAAAWICC